MDNNQKNSNNRTFKFGSVVFCLMLILLILNISFAWYAAKVNQGNIDLVSEGIIVSLNSEANNELTPDVLVDGVVNINPDDYVIYYCPTCKLSYSYNELCGNKCSNCYEEASVIELDASYVSEYGNTIIIKENVELYLDSSLTHKSTVDISYGVKYINKTGNEVELLPHEVKKYFDITTIFVNSSSEEVLINNLVTDNYVMTINVSYKLPNELLPYELISSPSIVLTVSGTLKNHCFTNYVWNDNATCSVNGTETATCDYCDVTDTRVVMDSTSPHVFTNYTSNNDASCSVNGTETATCENCSVTDTRVVIDSTLPHTFTSYTSNSDATIHCDGTETAICDDCGASDTRIDEDSHQIVTDYSLDANTLFTGALLYNVPQGKGTLLYTDLNCSYTGDIKDGVPHGQGKYTWLADGTTFVGVFEDGVATYGRKTTTNTDGLIWYEGAMLNVNEIDSTKKGYGYYVNAAEEYTYIGEMDALTDMSACTFDGEGTYTWLETGKTFVGTFESGVATYGRTTIARTDGLIWYEGYMDSVDAIDTDQSGIGYYVYEDTGCDYTGEMTALADLSGCLFNGEGTFRWPSGWIYEGTFENSVAKEGKTTTTKETGLIWYEGKMKSEVDENGQTQYVIASNELGYGCYVYENGDVYEGQMYGFGSLESCTFAGEGTYTWADGTVFEGTFEDGEAIEGTKTAPEGTATGLIWYRGKMKNIDEFVTSPSEIGYGYYVYDTGCTYEGDMYPTTTYLGPTGTCEYQGEGTFNWPSGWKYEGQFVDSIASNGITTTNKTSGLIWYRGAMTGEIINGHAQFVIDSEQLGEGYYVYNNGDTYEGQMYASGMLESINKIHGYGTYKYADGSSFIGTYENGVTINGKYTTTKTTGLVWYEGAMSGHLTPDPNGLGTGYYVYPDSCTYTGGLKPTADMTGCVFQGEGTFNWPSGWKFVGTFENGVAKYGTKTTTANSGIIWYTGAMIDLDTIDTSQAGRGYYRYENTMSYEGEMLVTTTFVGVGSTCIFEGNGTFNWTTYNEDGAVKAWGNRYEGAFVNGNAVGLTGTMTYARSLNGSNAAGLHYFTGIMETMEKVAANQTGNGKIVFEDGSYYIGDVYIDANYAASVTGTGTYYNADGTVK